jgi:hypothetical protein
MPPPADDSEVMIDHSALVQENNHVVLELNDKDPSMVDAQGKYMVDSQGQYIVDAQGQYKDGADLFGPKMQQLRLQLLQHHEEYQKLREPPVEQILHTPPHKVEASMAKKGMSLAVWFLFNSLTLILNKYVRHIYIIAHILIKQLQVSLFSRRFPLSPHSHSNTHGYMFRALFLDYPSFQMGPLSTYDQTRHTDEDFAFINCFLCKHCIWQLLNSLYSHFFHADGQGMHPLN